VGAFNPAALNAMWVSLLRAGGTRRFQRFSWSEDQATVPPLRGPARKHRAKKKPSRSGRDDSFVTKLDDPCCIQALEYGTQDKAAALVPSASASGQAG